MKITDAPFPECRSLRGKNKEVRGKYKKVRQALVEREQICVACNDKASANRLYFASAHWVPRPERRLDGRVVYLYLGEE